uniref:(northern house mosquito) hypothetical protein n=1 Tax=Culex pipiens TaxID=7175 RepID=A0A8D8BNR5_CULPI
MFPALNAKLAQLEQAQSDNLPERRVLLNRVVRIDNVQVLDLLQAALFVLLVRFADHLVAHAQLHVKGVQSLAQPLDALLQRDESVQTAVAAPHLALEEGLPDWFGFVLDI